MYLAFLNCAWTTSGLGILIAALLHPSQVLVKRGPWPLPWPMAYGTARGLQHGPWPVAGPMPYSIASGLLHGPLPQALLLSVLASLVLGGFMAGVNPTLKDLGKISWSTWLSWNVRMYGDYAWSL